MQRQRILGGTLLVAGTAIGAGMLAIPVITAKVGFVPSFFLMGAVWFYLFITAYLLLDVTLSCPGEMNLIGMTARMLGKGAKIGCWIVYLLLLYSLTAAYIAGSSALFVQAIQGVTGVTLPEWFGPIPLLFIFGLFVYLGTGSVDLLNRLLMLGLLVTYALLICFLPPHVKWDLLARQEPSHVWVAIPLLMTSFGFHIIIPTLTTYLEHHVVWLRRTILMGSLLPLLIYILWEGLILGIVPLPLLEEAMQAGGSATIPLAKALHAPWLKNIANYFSFFAIITSFLGVSLSLSDFLAEGLRLRRVSLEREIACLLTFVPPLLFVYVYPHGFIHALQYAGIFVAILLCIFPALMAWKLPAYQSFSKKGMLLLVIFLALGVIGIDLWLEVFSGVSA